MRNHLNQCGRSFGNFDMSCPLCVEIKTGVRPMELEVIPSPIKTEKVEFNPADFITLAELQEFGARIDVLVTEGANRTVRFRKYPPMPYDRAATILKHIQATELPETIKGGVL